MDNNIKCKEYLNKRSISIETIEHFRLGFSNNKDTSLYKFLKDCNFKDQDILKSNIVKLDKNKKFKDFFYNRLIFLYI